MLIPIDKIKISPDRRETVPAQVEKLAQSISELGLLNSITVDQDYTLIAGLHRIEAAKRLGWTEIECNVTSLAGLQAKLAEIDENIVRCDFSSMESNELLLRRKEIYESLHPETQQGKRNGQTSKNSNLPILEVKPFTQDTAEKLGISRCTVERKVKIARDLTPEAKKIISDHDIGSSKALKLSRLPPKQQREAAEMLASGKIKSVKEYKATHQQAASDKTGDAKKASAEGTEPPAAMHPPADDVPYSLGGVKYASVRESVADLKDPNKDCSCTPDSFLAEITEFVKKFEQEINWFHIPYYEPVFPILSQVQLDYFKQQMNVIHGDVKKLLLHIQKGRSNHE